MAPPISQAQNSYVPPPSGIRDPGGNATNTGAVSTQIQRYRPIHLDPRSFGLGVWEDVERGLTADQANAIYSWLQRIDTPANKARYGQGTFARDMLSQMRTRVMREGPSAVDQPAVPANPNAMDPNEIGGGTQFDRTKYPDYGGNTYVPPPPTEPLVPAQPPPTDTVTPGQPQVAGVSIAEANRGRAYYSVIQDGPYKGSLGYFVFDPMTRTYKPRQVTAEEWAKISANPQILEQVKFQVAKDYGPNFTIETDGGSIPWVQFQSQGRGTGTRAPMDWGANTYVPPEYSIGWQGGTRAQKASFDANRTAASQATFVSPPPVSSRTVRTSANSIFAPKPANNFGVAPGTVRNVNGTNYAWSLVNGQYRWIPRTTVPWSGGAGGGGAL